MREAANLTAREAARLIGVDHTKISHMETARFGVSADRIRVLADAYGCPDRAYVDALVAMAAERGRGWWEEYRGILPDGFLDLTELENKATSLRTYQVTHLPGLAQTPDYARAVFELTFPRLPKDDVEARIAHRMRRAQVLSRSDSPRYSAIIHEAALRMRFGGREVARRQLEHLLTLSMNPRCELRVIPFESAGFAGSGQAVLYASGPLPQLDTVHLDTAHGATFLSADAELGAYRDLLDAMARSTLSVKQSREAIKDIAQKL